MTAMDKEIRSSDSAFTAVLTVIPETVLGHGMEQFNEQEYESSLDDYTEKYRYIFEGLQEFCLCCPRQADLAVRETCKALIDAVERDIQTPEKFRGLNGRALQLDTCKMVILAYLTPAVFKMELNISRAFNDALHDEWLKRYPKQPYQVVTGPEIAAGFGRKWYQCFITQAVCGYLGKEDHGYELTAFRNYRDSYLRQCPDGGQLIEEYYRDAPGIVKRIELSGLGDEIYPKLWDNYLKPCLEDIENGRFEECKQRYIRMVRRLQERFL